MDTEEIRRIIDDAGPDDGAAEGSLRTMLGDFHGRRMRSIAVLVWVNGLAALVFAVASAVLFFRTDEIKYEIMSAVTFVAAIVWLATIKVFAWLAVNRNSISREIKRLEVSLAEASEVRQNRQG